MAGEPTLSTMTKLRLGAFASEMAVAHPGQAKTIFTLQETLEKRLPPDVQDRIIEKLNKDPQGTLAAAKDLINKNPKILEEVNRDPLKLAAVMGVQATPAPAVTKAAAPLAAGSNTSAPAVAAAPAPAPAANAPDAVNPPRQKAEPATVAAAPAAAPARQPATGPSSATPISDSELALRTKLGDEMVKVTRMEGFEEFAARAQGNQSLSQAVDAMMGRQAGSPQEALAALQDLQKDPQFFVKANKGIDEIPPQMRESVFARIAEDPQLGRDALQGDSNAKIQLMMNGMLGGGMAQKAEMGMFGKLMNSEAMSGLGNVIASFMRQAMAFLAPMLEKFTGAGGFMRMGSSEPIMLGRFAQTVDPNGSNKLVVDATRPDAPPTPMSELGKPRPEVSTPGELRKFEVAQAQNEPSYNRTANGPA